MSSQFRLSSRLRRRLAVIAVLAVAILVAATLLLIWPGWAYQRNWIGFWQLTGIVGRFGPTKDKAGARDYYPGKTLWDLAQLVVIPL
jgi:hypothetical protein